LNSVAYTLAEHGSTLHAAENWSRLSIGIVEKELNESSFANLQAQTWTMVVKLGQFWDTMGWIEFQQTKMAEAEKHVLAAWEVTDDLAIAMHLGRIYESQGRRNDAAEMYLVALSKVPPDQALNDDAKDTRKRLADILGGYS
jgi:hypothetical protein